MQKLQLPGWEGDFYKRSPLFDPLAHLAQAFSHCERWPDLAEYQNLLDAWPSAIKTLNGSAIKIVEQAGKPDSFEQHYAPRIYLTGEIQTRRENWHDFFQYLTWFMFPKTKALINSLHLPYAKTRVESGEELGRRSPLENMLSLFDEGGAVLISSDESLLQLVDEFRWKELFWQRRAELENKFQCIPFGHAVYEKGLAPYVGMTVNSIFLAADDTYFTLPIEDQLGWVDAQLVQKLKDRERFSKPKDLSPFPILGMPRWDGRNIHESYYDNSNYFRPGRRTQASENKPIS